MPRLRVAVTVLGLAFLTLPRLRAQTTLPSAERAALDSVVEWLTTNELLPGLAVAIVSGDQVIYRRDAGWADREAGRRVDSNTVFYIASTTKPLTSLAATLLDRDRVIALDATVSQILPGARLGVGVDPSRITVRQLLSHTHGINGNGPVQYRAAFSGEIDRSAMMRALAAHGPAEGGTAFRYTNFGYNLLSLALDSIAGKPWQDVLAERVFRPLGMRSTSARVSEIPRDRLAMPYGVSPDGLERMTYAKTDANMQAAGGVVTTTADLARLVIAELNGGRVDGRQVIPFDVIAETQRPLASFSEEAFDMSRFAYALGWYYGLVDGDTLVHALGGFPGFAAGASFMPSRKLGIVWLTNGGIGQPTPLIMYAYALLTGKPEAAARYRATIESVLPRLAAGRAEIAADRARRAQRPQIMALPFDAYAGRYEDPTWGSLEVSVRNGRLVVRNGVLECVAEVYDGAQHQLRVELEPRSGRVVTFQVVDGRAVSAQYNNVVYARAP
jgi:CubicO group peptidase (beta-lactamase class C family)